MVEDSDRERKITNERQYRERKRQRNSETFWYKGSPSLCQSAFPYLSLYSAPYVLLFLLCVHTNNFCFLTLVILSSYGPISYLILFLTSIFVT